MRILAALTLCAACWSTLGVVAVTRGGRFRDGFYSGAILTGAVLAIAAAVLAVMWAVETLWSKP